MGGIDGAGGRVVFLGGGRKESIGVGSNFLGMPIWKKGIFGENGNSEEMPIRKKGALRGGRQFRAALPHTNWVTFRRTNC